MIGLGSNRLTVCRRGGMSVTQAGRGGMEWLAGGREPSWTTPYSAQATAALKAQFPTQWPTIRDYGFAHPEIVGYMNAYAPEDAKIAYSLVEGIGTRWIVGTGTQYIKTTAIPITTTYIKTKLKATEQNGQYMFNYGSELSYNCTDRISLNRQNTGVFRLGICGADTTCGNYVIGNVYEIEHSMLQFKVNGSVLATSSGTPTNGRYPFWIFWECRGGAGVEQKLKGYMAYFEIYNSDSGNVFLYPFTRKINGGDVFGMLDVVSNTFYQNAGTGTFTELIESPS